MVDISSDDYQGERVAPLAQLRANAEHLPPSPLRWLYRRRIRAAVVALGEHSRLDEGDTGQARPLSCTCDYAGMEGEPHKQWCEQENGPHAGCAARVAVLAAEVERLEDYAANAVVRQANLKGMSVEDGAALLELESPREIVIAWVWAARQMLGDAPNYSETRIDFPKHEMEVKAAGEVDRYIFTVQRAGKVTPHEARKAAEAERDRLQASITAALALADDLPDLLQTYAWSHKDGTWGGYAEVVADRLRRALTEETP